jgi:hypothetical protein
MTQAPFKIFLDVGYKKLVLRKNLKWGSAIWHTVNEKSISAFVACTVNDFQQKQMLKNIYFSQIFFPFTTSKIKHKFTQHMK